MRLSPADRRLMIALAAAAGLAGVTSFLAGPGILTLLFPRALPPPISATAPATGSVQASTRTKTPRLPVARAVITTTDRRNRIRIPSLALDLPLAVAPSLADQDILRTLQVGVVRYPNGVEPGQRGVLFVSGHSTGEPWKGRYRFAFLRARRLEPGDVIYLDVNGSRYTYRVTGQRLVNPRSTPFLTSTADRPRLALISCWPLWTTQQRLVVDAELSGRSTLLVRQP